MKPILIDALHINMSGALAILNHLVNHLAERDIDFVLLKDSRAPELQSENRVKQIVVMRDSEWDRRQYYKAHRNDFHSVLCMGNVPPMIKMPCKVHTYFHNVSLLKIPYEYSLRWKIRTFFKKLIIILFANNTDNWIVQTTNTQYLVNKYLPTKGKVIYVLPIYGIPNAIDRLKNEKHGNDYVLIGFHTFAKGHDELLCAWKKLHHLGYNLRLHFTIQPTAPKFKEEICEAIKSGVNVVDHGKVPFEEVSELYRLAKAIVYPSYNESLGLGILEAIHAGCDVISTDLPFTHSICKPSEVFKVKDADSIVEAVLRYEKGSSPKSILTIRDCVNELIELIKK